jgi:hypothetical protein
LLYVQSTVSLGIQVAVLCLLITAIFLKKRNLYRQHGVVMLFAVVLHSIVILIVMVPSLAAFFSAPSLVDFTNGLTIMSLIHAFSGLAAALLGSWIVGSWHLQTSLKPCFRKKRFMDLTIILWSLAFSLGGCPLSGHHPSDLNPKHNLYFGSSFVSKASS